LSSSLVKVLKRSGPIGLGCASRMVETIMEQLALPVSPRMVLAEV